MVGKFLLSWVYDHTAKGDKQMSILWIVITSYLVGALFMPLVLYAAWVVAARSARPVQTPAMGSVVRRLELKHAALKPRRQLRLLPVDSRRLG